MARDQSVQIASSQKNVKRVHTVSKGKETTSFAQ
jgi:hypothetical protein